MRLYLHDDRAIISGATPGANVFGHATSQQSYWPLFSNLYTMNTDKGGSPSSLDSNSMSPSAGLVGVVRFSSPRIYPTHVDAQTWSLSFGFGHLGSWNVGRFKTVIYVWRPSTAQVIGTILDEYGQAPTTSIDLSIGSTNRCRYIQRTGAAVAGTLPGDIIVLELWLYYDNLPNAVAIKTWLDGPDVITSNNTDIGLSPTIASFFESQQDLWTPPRRPLFMTSEAPSAFVESTDELQLGKVTLTGLDGVAIDASSQFIVNVGAPISAKDAVNKQYVDTFFNTDFTPHPPVRLCANTNVSVSSAPVTVDSVTLISGNRLLLVGQTDPVENGIYVFSASGAALTRAADGVSPFLQPGSYVFVNEGSVLAHSAWVIFNDSGITTGVDAVNFQQFSGLGQVNAGAGLTKTGNVIDVGKGDGIALSASLASLDLDTAPGLSIGTQKLKLVADGARGLAVDAVGAYLKKTGTALLFDGSGALDLRVDPTGGIEVVSSGARLKLPDTDLALSAGDLRLFGLPSLFKINGVAVGASVSPANLATITDGSSVSTQHTHSSLSGVNKVIDSTFSCSADVAKGAGLYVSANNTVAQGSLSSDVQSRIVGVANAAATSGNAVDVLFEGTVVGVLSGATRGTRYYLGATGLPVLIGAIAAGDRLVQLGVAKNATDLRVEIIDFGRLGLVIELTPNNALVDSSGNYIIDSSGNYVVGS